MAPPTYLKPLSSVLPPLIFGTAQFNIQYNTDPFALDTTGLVQEALDLGVRAFDTSPYYGPAEELLGAALDTESVRNNFAREDYYILTKCGRIGGAEFDYSPEWVRDSVARSLKRLRTAYLDVVYCHDVEFVSPEEVLEAVRELRRIRDVDGTIKYVGISGYPVEVLCALSSRIFIETGEPVDIVQSYGNFNIQNTTLLLHGVDRMKEAGVDVVTNASFLNMGLLRRDGLPENSAGDWHPSPPGLRQAIRKASDFVDQHDERLEVIAIRWAIETWMDVGQSVGSYGDPASGAPFERESKERHGSKKLGVSVMGVSRSSELHKTMGVWRSILDGREDGAKTAARAGRWKKAHEWSVNRRLGVQLLVEGAREQLGEWVDFSWQSPPKDFVNKHTKGSTQKSLEEQRAPWPTPDGTPEPPSRSTEQLPLR